MAAAARRAGADAARGLMRSRAAGLQPDDCPPEAVSLMKAGARIGLLGGSFNPAHAAHRHISLIALRRLGLDAVVWLVSPQNPLKSKSGMASLERRLARAREVALHPRIHVSAIERALGTRFTIDTVKALKRRFPKARFVWLMGSDNLAELHRWRRWEEIAALMPFAAIARPRFTTRALRSRAAAQLRDARLRPEQAKLLAEASPPAWIFLQERLDPSSATALRARGVWR
jgi:nicotinate-nucleotide adenylyltransferase